MIPRSDFKNVVAGELHQILFGRNKLVLRACHGNRVDGNGLAYIFVDHHAHVTKLAGLNSKFPFSFVISRHCAEWIVARRFQIGSKGLIQIKILRHESSQSNLAGIWILAGSQHSDGPAARIACRSKENHFVEPGFKIDIKFHLTLNFDDRLNQQAIYHGTSCLARNSESHGTISRLNESALPNNTAGIGFSLSSFFCINGNFSFVVKFIGLRFFMGRLTFCELDHFLPIGDGRRISTVPKALSHPFEITRRFFRGLALRMFGEWIPESSVMASLQPCADRRLIQWIRGRERSLRNRPQFFQINRQPFRCEPIGLTDPS